MPSFDIVSEVNLPEAVNAVDQANREVSTRFDFKGTDAKFELADTKITLRAQSEFQLKQMLAILETKLTKRGIAIGCLEFGNVLTNLNEARQIVTIKQGIETELAKKLVKTIKDSKLKVQTAIQGEQVRVTGKNRDDLQEVIALMRAQKINLPLQFTNFRD
jgi:cyclic-di-GMP-binding protein